MRSASCFSSVMLIARTLVSPVVATFPREKDSDTTPGTSVGYARLVGGKFRQSGRPTRFFSARYQTGRGSSRTTLVQPARIRSIEFVYGRELPPIGWRRY